MKLINAKTKLRKYPIYFQPDIIKKAPFFINKYFIDAEKVVLITNDKIYGIYENNIKNFLEQISLKFEIIITGDGEENKNLKSAESIYSNLVKQNLHRNDIIIAFGGGVIGDLAGFVASTFHRGIKLIQIPTTIIGQVDSSIGGKVVLNYRNIKNVIGSFYQPHMIIIDPTFLYTLDENEIVNGLAEIVKYGLVFDGRILRILEDSIDEVKEDRLFKLVRSEVFHKVIFKCALIKTRVVKKDEFDLDCRNLLNFGHTIGHCLENAADLKEISHGQAVSMGMMVAINISIKMGFLNNHIKNKIIKLYKKLKLPYIIPDLDMDKILKPLKYDKKFTAFSNKFVLLKGIGRPVFFYNLNRDIIINSIKICINNYL